jgi:hypothetical protein
VSNSGEHGQRVEHVDHVVQPGAEEVVVGHRRSASRTPRKRDPLNRLFGDLTIGNRPGTPTFIRVSGVLLSRLYPRGAAETAALVGKGNIQAAASSGS